MPASRTSVVHRAGAGRGAPVGGEQGLIDDPVLGQGRDPPAPLQDVIIDEGDMAVCRRASGSDSPVPGRRADRPARQAR